MKHPDNAAWQRWLARVCVGVPLAMLAANLIAWLRYGTDMPFIDDWRAYRDGNIDSFALTRLFQVVNNTISPVGFGLDTLAQIGLDGNSIAYQFLSMLLVLGALLWLQWRLLGWAIADSTTRVLAFAATIFMLQAGSYWGEQNLAYHQALPLVFLLGVAALVLTGQSGKWLTASISFALSAMAGLSYISGAVAALTLGATWMAMSSAGRRSDALRERIFIGGLAATLAGAVTASIQIYLTRLRPGADPALRYELTSPDKPEFWLFLIGKIGRALGHAISPVGMEFIFALIIAASLAASFLWLIRRIIRPVADAAAWRLACFYVPFALVVAIYLLLVSFGRTSVRDSSIRDAWDVFQFAYYRFHFFWVTLLLPWVLGVAVIAWPCQPAAREWTFKRAALLLAAMFILGAGRGVFDVNRHYADNAKFRAGEIRCMAEQLGSGEHIRCPSFDMKDWTPAYAYARHINASFIKYFPVVAQQPAKDVLLRWASGSHSESNATMTAKDVQSMPDGWWLGGDDPQMLFQADDEKSFNRCQVIELDIGVRSKREETLQIFFLKRGRSAYTEQDSLKKPILAGLKYFNDVKFTLDHPDGFEGRFRIDPGSHGAQFQLMHVRAACRLRM